MPQWILKLVELKQLLKIVQGGKKRVQVKRRNFQILCLLALSLCFCSCTIFESGLSQAEAPYSNVLWQLNGSISPPTYTHRKQQFHCQLSLFPSCQICNNCIYIGNNKSSQAISYWETFIADYVQESGFDFIYNLLWPQETRIVNKQPLKSLAATFVNVNYNFAIHSTWTMTSSSSLLWKSSCNASSPFSNSSYKTKMSNHRKIKDFQIEEHCVIFLWGYKINII